MHIFVSRNGAQIGSFPEEEVRARLASSQLVPTDLAWREGMATWIPLSQMLGVSSAAGAYIPGAVPPGAAAPATYAGFWLRVAAVIIDSFVMLVPSLIVGFALGFGLALAGARPSENELQAIGQVLGIFLNWLYSAIMESSPRQATLGKMAVGIRVTDLNGNRISFAQASGRFFGKIVSALILCVGFIMAGFTERRQALHDMMAGTLVVRSR